MVVRYYGASGPGPLNRLSRLNNFDTLRQERIDPSLVSVGDVVISLDGGRGGSGGGIVSPQPVSFTATPLMDARNNRSINQDLNPTTTQQVADTNNSSASQQQQQTYNSYSNNITTRTLQNNNSNPSNNNPGNNNDSAHESSPPPRATYNEPVVSVSSSNSATITLSDALGRPSTSLTVSSAAGQASAPLPPLFSVLYDESPFAFRVYIAVALVTTLSLVLWGVWYIKKTKHESSHAYYSKLDDASFLALGCGVPPKRLTIRDIATSTT